MSKMGTIHIDTALTNLSLKYANGEYVGDQIFPIIPVGKESGKFFVYGRPEFQNRNALRANGAHPNYIDILKMATPDSYLCEEYELADVVTQRDVDNADAPLTPYIDTVNNLTDNLMLIREVRIAALATAAATFATTGNTITLAGVQQWNDPAYVSTGANAIEKRITTAKEAVRAIIGRYPNTIVIPSAVATVVSQDSAIRDLRKYTENTLVINGMLPPTLWGMKVLSPGGITNSANEGQAFAGTDIWGKHVLLAYVAPSPSGVKTFTFGATFQNKPRQIAKWYNDEKRGDVIEAFEIVDEKLVCEGCGYLIRSAIA